MPPIQFKARLEDKVQHNAKFVQYMFELEQPHTLTFEAGQYVSIKVSEQGERRSYSVWSSPSIDHGIELLVDITPQGKGSTYLESLKFGDVIDGLGPLGRFVVAPPETGEEALIFIATGSGITPYNSMMLDQLQAKQDTRPITIFWGLRYPQDLFWVEEFQIMEKAFPNFKFHPVLSKAHDEWPLCRGRVTDCLNTHALPPNAGYYLCGNAPMIADVIALLQAKGIAPERIHHEKFY